MIHRCGPAVITDNERAANSVVSALDIEGLRPRPRPKDGVVACGVRRSVSRESQRTGADGGGTGVGISPGKDRRARAGLGHGAAPTDGIGKRQAGIAASELEPAPVQNNVGGIAAEVASRAIADHQRALVDGCLPRIEIACCEDDCVGARFGQPATAGYVDRSPDRQCTGSDGEDAFSIAEDQAAETIVDHPSSSPHRGNCAAVHCQRSAAVECCQTSGVEKQGVHGQVRGRHRAIEGDCIHGVGGGGGVIRELVHFGGIQNAQPKAAIVSDEIFSRAIGCRIADEPRHDFQRFGGVSDRSVIKRGSADEISAGRRTSQSDAADAGTCALVEQGATHESGGEVVAGDPTGNRKRAYTAGRRVDCHDAGATAQGQARDGFRGVGRGIALKAEFTTEI